MPIAFTTLEFAGLLFTAMALFVWGIIIVFSSNTDL
jgi:hypothetical protein